MSELDSPQEIPDWIAQAAHGDSELAALLLRQEDLFKKGEELGGGFHIDEHTRTEMNSVIDQIQARKHELGLDEY